MPIGSPSDVVPQGIVTAGKPSKFAKIQLDGHSNMPKDSVPGGRVLGLRNGLCKTVGHISNSVSCKAWQKNFSSFSISAATYFSLRGG